ncbi:Steroid Delta-isomerase [Sinobacterium norvegicum]|uniref:Steroid Delta-isomerase n=1 Tax=Sinobacterium norvegicum TaxID=1641715 RepID=A0ABN8EFY5_9GAMM|nr:nuclear transport factor 2 family protein [Sinobacterium norvegicum]CAH0991186.1 Steroid Delta-isomerase [Sinobacterium norvegicum]
MSKLNDQHIADTLQAYVEAVSGDDVEKILELFTADAVVEDPIGTGAHQGTEALRAFYQIAIDSVELMELEGNARIRDKWGAAAMLAHPKGVDLVIETLDVMEFNDDGLISQMTAYWGDRNMVAK